MSSDKNSLDDVLQSRQKINDAVQSIADEVTGVGRSDRTGRKSKMSRFRTNAAGDGSARGIPRKRARIIKGSRNKKLQALKLGGSNYANRFVP
jgi:hypothetical protein